MFRESKGVASDVLHNTLAAEDARVVVLKPSGKGDCCSPRRSARHDIFLLEAVVPHELRPSGHVCDAADVEVLEAVQECR